VKIGTYAPFRHVLLFPSSWYKMKGPGFSKSCYQFTKLHGVTSQYIVAVWSAFIIWSLTQKLRFSFSFLTILKKTCPFWDWRLLGLTPSGIDAAFSGEAFLTLGRCDNPLRQREMASKTKRHTHEDRNIQQNFRENLEISKTVDISFVTVGTFKSICKNLLDIYRAAFTVARRTLFWYLCNISFCL
jgi:hypothetical protein